MRKAPRTIDASLLAAMQQMDFVGHAANPFYKRSLQPGEAARLAFPLGELRKKPPPVFVPGWGILFPAAD